jgi:hypothetical protein
MDSHSFSKLDPDPHSLKKLDPDCKSQSGSEILPVPLPAFIVIRPEEQYPVPVNVPVPMLYCIFVAHAVVICTEWDEFLTLDYSR